jgi:RNA polymerase sigma-70 factor (TIGR02960 family)
MGQPAPLPYLPEPTGLGEVLWLEPYPDLLLDQLMDTAPGPEARFEAREAVSLAFVTALQLLPPRQRAVLILRDVLGFHAREVAQILDSTEESVTSALKRARATLQRRLPRSSEREQAPAPGCAAERELVERFTRAYEAQDVSGIVGLLTEDVWLTMPPDPLEWQGDARVAQCLTATATPHVRRKLVATRANGQPAFGIYVRDPRTRILHGVGLLVLTLADHRICAITRFDTSVLASFGLPRILPD